MEIPELLDLASAYWKSAALSAAVQNGLFDALNDGADSSQALSKACGTSLLHTHALCDALVGMDVLIKKQERYAIPPNLKAVLDSRDPNSLIAALRFNQDLYQLWGGLGQTVKSGDPMIPANAHLGSDPEQAVRFVHGMHSRARVFAPALINALDVKGCSRLLDVAGGPGTFSAMLAEQQETLKVTIFDLPPIIAAAEKLHEQSPARSRLHFHPGDYHADPFPSSFDAVLYCGALHQETVEQARSVLASIFNSLEPGGRCFVVDVMLDDERTQPLFSALFELNMMLMRPSSHVYTSKEAEKLLREAGFESVETKSVFTTPYWIITARKPLIS
jgi:ubiquinone/menaquinone biosynthesis C-methylase UbiE